MSAITSGDLSVPNDSSIEETVNTLVQIVEQQQEQISELSETVEQQSETIEELEEEVASLREDSARDRASIKKRLTAVEEDISEDQTPTPQTDKTTTVEAETAIEDITALPHEVAEKNLTQTQERARFICTDLADYTSKCPAGRVLTASDLKRVLNAKEPDSTIYNQQVSRVIDCLEQLSEGEVVVKDGRDNNGRRIVFKTELARRLKNLSSSDGDTVVTPTTVGSVTS